MAEGAPLLREYTVMSCIKGSNPFVSAKQNKATFWVAFLFRFSWRVGTAVTEVCSNFASLIVYPQATFMNPAQLLHPFNNSSFAAYQADALGAGYHEVLERIWPADTVLETHSHAFDAEALVTQGEMWLTCGADTQYLTPGGRFKLARDVPHSERYGPEGATYWVARRKAV